MSVWTATDCEEETDHVHLKHWLAKAGHGDMCWTRDDAYYIRQALNAYFEKQVVDGCQELRLTGGYFDAYS